MQENKHIKFINKMNIINKNIKILDIYNGARQKINCLCLLCNKTWYSTPDNLLHGHGCPNCNKLDEHKITKILFDKNIEIIDKFIDITKKYTFKCRVCNNIWETHIGNILYRNTICPHCSKLNKYNGFNKDGSIKNNYINYNLSKLLLEENESYYWIGFLIADGHFDKNNRIILHLGKDETYHIKNFANFIEYNNNINKEYIQVMQNKIVQEIKNKFDISNNKTYNPCNIENIENDNLFISLLIGFIDGDGNIINQYKRNDCAIRIKLYKSWDNNLLYMINRLFKICELKYNGSIHYVDNYCYITFSNQYVVNYLKNKTKELNLTVLSRKWDKIKGSDL